MPTYEFKIIKTATFTLDASSRTQASSIVNNDIEHYLNKNTKGCCVSAGIEIEDE